MLIAAPDPGAGRPAQSSRLLRRWTLSSPLRQAADTDVLFNGATQLINNQVDPIGTKVVLTGLTVGQTLNFVFKNTSASDSFQRGVAASDGVQHVAIQSTYADLIPN